MTERRYTLRDMVFDEISFVDEGAHPGAEIVFTKSKDATMPAFSDILATKDNARASAELSMLLDALDTALNSIIFDPDASVQEVRQRIDESVEEFKNAVGARMEGVIVKSLTGPGGPYGDRVRSLLHKAANPPRARDSAPSPSSSASRTVPRSREEVQKQVDHVADLVSQERGISHARAVREVLRTSQGRQLREAYQNAESVVSLRDHVEKRGDIGGESVAYGLLERKADEHALKHGISKARAMREVSRQHPDHVAAHRGSMND